MWHQDWPYWPSLSAPEQVTAWIALDDIGPGNGCMSTIPGSHLLGNQISFLHSLVDPGSLLAEFAANRLQILKCPVQKGEVRFHCPLTWYGSPANISSHLFRAIAFHYMCERTSFVAHGKHLCNPLTEWARRDIWDSPASAQSFTDPALGA